MKKHILVILGALICSMSIMAVDAKTSVKSPELSEAIKMYKAQNYSESYKILNAYVNKEQSNALAYYYLAMSSAQIGNKNEAVENYEKVLRLTSPESNLGRYATKGKTCIVAPEACHVDETQSDSIDAFIRSNYGNIFSKKVRSQYEQQKIENLMREMNRGKDVAPSSFKGYKDFSYETPSNDEIVAALRVLQRAGLNDVVASNISDFSILTGGQTYGNEALLNMLTGKKDSLNPQVIQSLLTNQMSIGF